MLPPGASGICAPLWCERSVSVKGREFIDYLRDSLTFQGLYSTDLSTLMNAGSVIVIRHAEG